ncbi:Fibroblast growth factor receptor 2 [Frankliniella fusca]|uniref:Fibroblast growth factor receptor 2 n=1 Tax=Frankliniella fusca TaxID=407009 RepID=A0AAE1LBP0_9NEOP|nr:Fibroblast growth factor receptor 2 [Frankliniella fusca]
MPLRICTRRLRAGEASGAGAGAGAEAGAALEKHDNAPHVAEPTDPADTMDDAAIDGGHWMDTEIAVGSIVAILLVAAMVAVWISCRRRRRVRDPAEEPGTTAERIVHQLQTAHEVKEIPCRKVSCLKPPSLKVAVTPEPDLAANGNGYPIITTVPPVSPEPSLNPNGVPEISPAVNGTPWEPCFLGIPGQVTRARRRSVSLRSGDDEGGSDDGDVSGTSSTSRGPSPTNLSPGDTGEEATRKRSVTFNAMVEEVQILSN